MPHEDGWSYHSIWAQSASILPYTAIINANPAPEMEFPVAQAQDSIQAPAQPLPVVWFSGPNEDATTPEWTVFIGTPEGEPISKVYYPRSFESAGKLAFGMAKQHHIRVMGEARRNP